MANESWAKGQKNQPMKSRCGCSCPSLGAGVFGAFSSPSVLGFSKKVLLLRLVPGFSFAG
jgi:hypothetical protein